MAVSDNEKKDTLKITRDHEISTQQLPDEAKKTNTRLIGFSEKVGDNTNETHM